MPGVILGSLLEMGHLNLSLKLFFFSRFCFEGHYFFKSHQIILCSSRFENDISKRFLKVSFISDMSIRVIFGHKSLA